MATQAQMDGEFQHLSCHMNAKGVKYCKNCIASENQFANIQEELKTAKSHIIFFSKTIEMKELNLDKGVKGITGEEMDEKFSIWSDVIKGVNKSDTDIRQIGLKSIKVIVNQGITHESHEKFEGINTKTGDVIVRNYTEITNKTIQVGNVTPLPNRNNKEKSDGLEHVSFETFLKIFHQTIKALRNK
jgi:hypothetical protein